MACDTAGMGSSADLATVVVFLGVLALFGLAQAGKGRRRSLSRRRWNGPRPSYLRGNQPTSLRGVPDAVDQLRSVERAAFASKPLLRFQESKVFAAAEAAVREAGVPWRVFAQVSLGEVLTCQDREGFNAINAKRVDLLIADAGFKPLAAIEYQGTGHHVSKAAARDAIKKEALRKAGIGYIEITHEHGPQDVRREIGRLAFTQAAKTNVKSQIAARG